MTDHLLITPGAAPLTGEDPIAAARRGIAEREAKEREAREAAEAQDAALGLLLGVYQDPELMGPLPDTEAHGVCCYCSRRAAVWGFRVDVDTPNECVAKYCSRCYWYDSPWGRNCAEKRELFAERYEEEHGKLTRHAETKRFTHPMELLGLLNVVWAASRTLYFARKNAARR